METTVDSGMCRCCASEGLFKDVNTTYHWMGEDEVYADMLHFCFDITLASAEGQNNGGICEVCITQLRNAANFKKQVQHTEEQFKKRLAQVNSYKPEVIKVEMSVEDGAESDNNLSEDYQSGPEFEVPIKEESPEPKPKKRAAKATTSKAKKVKTDSGETSTKRILHEDELNSVKKLKETNKEIKRNIYDNLNEIRHKDRVELKKHYTDIEVILICTNATPIRKRGGIGYVCCYCSEECADPAELKKHTIYQHKGTSIYNVSFTSRRDLNAFYVKLNITSLRCDICGDDVNTLEDIVDHLKTAHNIFMHTDIIHRWIAFKFESETLRCYICSIEFSRFKMLLEHMHKHFRNFICEICESGFVTMKQQMTHLTCHTTGSFQCDYCSKTFNSHKKKKLHEKSVHTHSNETRNKCGFCTETFKNFFQKENHLKRVHSISSEVRCKACNKTFARPKAYRMHMRRNHLMERQHACNECDMKFFLS